MLKERLPPRPHPMNRFKSYRSLFFAALGGIVFALTAPPTNLYPASVIGLSLFAFSLADAPTFFRAFGRGAMFATAAGIVGLRFVPTVILRFTSLGSGLAYLALVLLAAAQSLPWAFGGGVCTLLIRRGRIPFEAAFGAATFTALCIPTIFAWTPAGLVSPWPELLQLADLIGERGVSVLFAAAAALMARSALMLRGRPPGSPAPENPAPLRLSHRALHPILAAIVLFIALAVHGRIRIAAIQQASLSLPAVPIALINQAVQAEERWDPKNHPMILKRLRALTLQAENQGAALTVWPEAAYPYPLDHIARRAPTGNRAILSDGVRGPVLFGLITRARPVSVDGFVELNSYNSATLVSPDGNLKPSYDKLQLLWFGEMVPGGAYFPALRRIFQKSGGLIPGEKPVALHLDPERDTRAGQNPRAALHMGVLNCYEDTLTGVGRQIVRALQPNLLVNVTNDVWFSDTAEPELHARLAVMRAVELRLDLIRAVNYGVTSWVDASGTTRLRKEQNNPFVVMVHPAIREGQLTPYARMGDIPMLAAFAALILASGLRAFMQAKAKTTNSGQ